MTDSAPSSPAPSDAGAARSTAGRHEKRPRTTYLVYRRYRLMGRLALALGGAAGLVLVAYSLVPSLLAGERVPPTTFAIAGVIIAAMALLPYSLVRWRWRQIRARLEED